MITARKNTAVICLLAAVILLSAIPVSAQKSVTGEDDILELMTTAEQEFDLTEDDAAILLDDISYTWTDNGRLITTVHRIIYVGTDVGVETYGDHRIPYDHANCTFDVVTVRTWRGTQHWETGETGIVETLPYRLEPAYDYSNMREMMLLHDGIEIPCILEVMYTIEDKRPYRSGAEGIRYFQRRHPSVKSRFSLTVPRDMTPGFAASDGVPDPVQTVSEEYNMTTYRWTMGPLAALPYPQTDDPAAYAPHIIWSVWNNWNSFGDYLDGVFKQAQSLDSFMIKTLDSVLVDARTGSEKAGLIADFIEERTSFIDYPEHYWWSSPRPAVRTYATAYGHRLDRAILAAALVNQAGLIATPVFIGDGFGPIDNSVPSLARLGSVGVWISGPDLEAYYDASEGSIHRGITSIIGKTVWSPGIDDIPSVRVQDLNEHSRLEIILDMTIDAESDTIDGRGYLFADNCMNVFSRMEGLSDEGKEFLDAVVAGLLEGAEVTDYSLNRFDLFNVTCGFEFTMKKPENDDFDRLALIIGDPEGGLYEHLPDDVVLYDNKRRSPVLLQCRMYQKIELRIKLKGLEPVYLPENKLIENESGKFTITLKQDDRLIDISRELFISQTRHENSSWPDLRALLLADVQKLNRALLFRTKADSEKE